MTPQEQQLADDNMRAEIANLGAQTALIQQQMKWQIPVYVLSLIGVIIAVARIFPASGG